MKEIEVKGIKKIFNNKNVLDNISFSVEKGELMCLLGPSVVVKYYIKYNSRLITRGWGRNFNKW